LYFNAFQLQRYNFILKTFGKLAKNI
jgi:hypothetical protein